MGFWISGLILCSELSDTIKEVIFVSTCLLQLGLELWHSILLWYETDEVVNNIEDSLELGLWWDNDLSLGVAILMFKSMLVDNWTSLWDKKASEVKIDDLFTDSLIDATIQDGGKRERSMLRYITTQTLRKLENILFINC